MRFSNFLKYFRITSWNLIDLKANQVSNMITSKIYTATSAWKWIDKIYFLFQLNLFSDFLQQIWIVKAQPSIPSVSVMVVMAGLGSLYTNAKKNVKTMNSRTPIVHTRTLFASTLYILLRPNGVIYQRIVLKCRTTAVYCISRRRMGSISHKIVSYCQNQIIIAEDYLCWLKTIRER